MGFASDIQQRGSVSFPAFTAERVYMRAFTKANGLPADLKRWQGTVDAMLDGVSAPGPIYLMVDQAPVRAGFTHRRPGPHVDGYWDPGYQCHGGDPGGGGHITRPPSHSPQPSPSHRGTPPGHLPTPRHLPAPRHGGTPARHAFGAGWDAELLLLATDVLGCEAYVGHVAGVPGDGGDCAALDLSGLVRVDLAPGRVWAGHTAHMLHASLPHTRDGLRTVVRLNVAGGSV